MSVHDFLTEYFISENPVNVSVQRHVRQRDASGGYDIVPSGPPLAPQRVRLVATNNQIFERTLPDGRIIRPERVLVAPLDQCDFERYDTFVVEGHDWEIIYVHRGPYSFTAEVVRHGG
jgi:hypothetical protein